MQTITYIKEGKERKISRLNYVLFGKQGVYSIEEDSKEIVVYRVSEDIELLHLKNFKFANSVKFYLQNQDTVLMLEECGFSNRIEIHNGTILIENPIYNNSESNIVLYDSKYVELNLKESTIKNSQYKRPYVYSFVNVKELKMTGDGSKTNARIECFNTDKITLENIKDPYVEGGGAEELRISNAEIKKGFGYLCDNYKKINIENSVFIVNDDALDFSKTKELQIKNSIIECPLIFLPNGKSRRHHELEFSSTKEDASGNIFVFRLNLLSSLKTMVKETEHKYETNLKDAELQDEYFKLAEPLLEEMEAAEEKMKYYQNLIATNEESLCEIDNSYEQEIELKKDEFEKQKIKTLFESNKEKKEAAQI